MKVDIIRSEIIKPSSPTPENLKTLKFSLLDQIAPLVYTSALLFYPNDENVFTSDEISQTLKKSLSQTLSSFYPLAGKINLKDSVIECNDDGARFIEAECDGLLSAVLENRHAGESVLRLFLPIDTHSPEARVTPLHVQATFFSGSLALGVCVSHKLADAATLALFLKTWAAASTAAAAGSTGNLNRVDFEPGLAVFPPWDLSSKFPEKLAVEKAEEEWTTRRYVIDKSKIAALKAKTTAEFAPTRLLSRVEAVTALLWKCAAMAAFTPRSVLVQIVNMRARVEPPFPENSAGNLVGFFAGKVDRDAELAGAGVLGLLAAKLRRGIEGFVENTAKKLRGDRTGNVLLQLLMEGKGIWFGEKDVNVLACTSWCRFGFYEIDFGFGKPSYVASVQTETKENLIILMDTRDGEGIEVCLTLTKQNMISVESDPDLLEFASSGF